MEQREYSVQGCDDALAAHGVPVARKMHRLCPGAGALLSPRQQYRANRLADGATIGTGNAADCHGNLRATSGQCASHHLEHGLLGYGTKLT